MTDAVRFLGKSTKTAEPHGGVADTQSNAARPADARRRRGTRIRLEAPDFAEGASVTPNDAFEFFVELVSQLFHADPLIIEQAEQIEALEAVKQKTPRIRRRPSHFATCQPLGRQRDDQNHPP